MRKLKCSICGYVYDEAAGIPDKGIAPGTKWEDIPESFTCPVCTAPKSVFAPLDQTPDVHISEPSSHTPKTAVRNLPHENSPVHSERLVELSDGEISAICSSLAKGCEKQRLLDEMDAFNKIADFYKSRMTADGANTLSDAAKMLADDLSNGFPSANSAASSASDRGALRSLVWSEKVSAMMSALFDRFSKEGSDMLKNTKVFVCDICGFIFVGDEPPEICPVCKVPNFKILQVEV